MKKVFFLLHSMNVGGVEKALLGLLSVLPLDQWEVHVGLIRVKGGFLDFLPKEVKVHEIGCYAKYLQLINDPPLSNIKQMLYKGKLMDAFMHSLLYVHFKLTSNRYWFYKYLLRDEPMYPEDFDLAVTFAGPSQMMDYYICEKVHAKKKCGWIHFDVSKFGIDKGMSNRLYKSYQKIFIVSEEGKEIFDKLFPQFSYKTEVIYNVVSYEQIKSLAEIGPTFEDDFQGKRILTVGRVSEEKGQRIAIHALLILLEKGYSVKWYFVGDGNDMHYCKHLVEELNLTQHVTFWGSQTNPYAFMKNCDIYMQPSRHEGFCITLAEALCFTNPIIATCFSGAREQLKNRDNCLVTDMTAENIAFGLETILLSGCQKCKMPNPPTVDIQPFLNLLNK